eukprot:TRINITY_DN112654_c0_g1_i1.p1 TRINITY_DN112654_c0_g1~~TRINITY_DN112654_c0_g1_i1.p1  ORF type:complete len:423 (-),score=87.17 TRINITY_DN112654_c0_g1_i1:32-1300(-)
MHASASRRLWGLAFAAAAASALRLDDDSVDGWLGHEAEASKLGGSKAVAWDADGDDVQHKDCRSRTAVQITRQQANTAPFRASQDQVRALRAFGKNYIGEWESSSEDLSTVRQIVEKRKAAVEAGLKADEDEDEYCRRTAKELRQNLSKQKQLTESSLEAFEKAAFAIAAHFEVGWPGHRQTYASVTTHREEMHRMQSQVQRLLDTSLPDLGEPGATEAGTDVSPPVAKQEAREQQSLEEVDQKARVHGNPSKHTGAPDHDTLTGVQRWYKPDDRILPIGEPASQVHADAEDYDDGPQTDPELESRYKAALAALQQSQVALQELHRSWQAAYRRCFEHRNRRTPEYEAHRDERKAFVQNLDESLNTLDGYRHTKYGNKTAVTPEGSSSNETALHDRTSNDLVQDLRQPASNDSSTWSNEAGP